MSVAWSRHALAWLAVSACASQRPAQDPERPPQPAVHTAPLAGSGAPTPAPAPAASAPAQAAKAEPRACGSLGCLAFATPEAAFEYVLALQPRVLAIGEAHAQAGTTGIRSSTRRFAEQFLPLLSGKSKHIVIELLLANCQPKTVERAAQVQAPVTKQQAKGNQNEFLTLGKYAQRLGIEPQALAPDCAQYDSVAAAGEEGVARLLTLVAQQTQRSVETLLAKPDTSYELILTYGGALHNDLYPRPGQEGWSFGPQLAAASHGRYLELDLIVPEFVKDTEAWRGLPWFGAFDRERLSNETLLYRPAASSFALIFPKTETTPAQEL
jgi:hypothetical protein